VLAAVVLVAACSDGDELGGTADPSVPSVVADDPGTVERPTESAELVERYVSLMLDGEVEAGVQLRCGWSDDASDDDIEAVQAEVGALLLATGPMQVDEVERLDQDEQVGPDGDDLWSVVLVSGVVHHEPFVAAVSEEDEGCVANLSTGLGLDLRPQVEGALPIGAQSTATVDDLLAVDGVVRLRWEVRRYDGDDPGIVERYGEGVVEGAVLTIAGVSDAYASTVEVVRYEAPEAALHGVGVSAATLAGNAVAVLPEAAPAALGLRVRDGSFSGLRPPDVGPWRDAYWMVCGDTAVVTSILTSTIPPDGAATRLQELADRAGGCAGEPPVLDLAFTVDEA
jgi:hypothetical protein